MKAVLAEHGLTLRGQRARTGLSHVTVMGMTQGYVPEMQSVVKFARGFGLDVNEWLELAGYEPIVAPAGDADAPTVAARLGAGLIELGRRFHRKDLTVREMGGWDSLTHADVDRILASLERELEEEAEELRRREQREPRR